MKTTTTDRLAIILFLVFLAAYLFLATYVCRDITRNTFDVIQGGHVFDIDDSYRLFLSRGPLLSPGLWVWNFILPVNVAFDGFFSAVTNHGIYWMRASHIIVVLLSLYLVYRAGRNLGISAAWTLGSCCLLMLMPLYALLSMSFYGESLLAAGMGVVIYAMATGRQRLTVFFLSLFPLIRPEGIFFLGSTALGYLHQRRFKSLILLVLPGFIYFCIMLYFFSSISGFMGWRTMLDKHYGLLPPEESVMGHGLMPYYTINPLWWMAGVSAAWLSSVRVLRPLFAGAAIFILYIAVQSYMGEVRAEPRYFYSLLPLFALSLAAGMDALCRRIPVNKRRIAQVACSGFMVLVIMENFAQIDAVRANLFADRRWPLPGGKGASPYLYIEDPEITQWRQTTSRFLEAYSHYDRSIKKIIIHAYPFFYELNPDRLPDGVEVEYAPMTPKGAFNYFGGNFYAMFPRIPQYAFYTFAPASSAVANDGGSYALYVGGLYNGIHPPLFANPIYQVYKVRYEVRHGLPDHLFTTDKGK
ncbi:MAG: hypothetical protein K0R03_99 [Moraxellaceae bacterium]|jgi:hypothetical protein|nr:hypothetical protein [Moraxellaceae bacterium]